MCNDYEQRVTYAEYRKAMEAIDLRVPPQETELALPQADDIRIGDTGPVMRIAEGEAVELFPMTFGFPPPEAKGGREKAGRSSISVPRAAVLRKAAAASSRPRPSSNSPARNIRRRNIASR